MWHIKLGNSAILQPPQGSKIFHENRIGVRKVRNAPTWKRYWLITHASTEQDQKFVGEFLAIISPEDRAPYCQVWSADSITRAGQAAGQSIRERRNVLEGMRLDNSIAIDTIYHNWASLRNNPVAIAYFSGIMSLHANRLIVARTRFRNEAGNKLALAADLRDSTGRVNPGATCASLVASSRRLEAQLELDKLSLTAATEREGFGNLLQASLDLTLKRLEEFLLVATTADLRSGLIWRYLERFECKPYFFGMRVIDGMGYLEALDDGYARDQIIKVLFAERMLWQLSDLLSLVKYYLPELEHVYANWPNDIIELLGETAPPTKHYRELFDQVTAALNSLSQKRSDKVVEGVVCEVKELVRYRNLDNLEWPANPLTIPNRPV